MMSSPLIRFFDFTIPNALHLAGILVGVLICLRLLRAATDKLVKPAATQTKWAQQREQYTREVASKVYATGKQILWAAAALTALPEFGISALPGVVLAAAVILAVGIAARESIRDAVAGFQIVAEDQFVAGDTIQAGDIVGRVEQWTLRRTVVRDSRGALVSLSNGDLRTVNNLSRDWSQAFVDVAVAEGTPLEKTLQAVESAAVELRSDTAWSQALVDGPRVLGLQEYDGGAATLRIQVRTAPTRQDEVCRELRRRIYMQFQRHGIAATSKAPSEGTGAPLT